MQGQSMAVGSGQTVICVLDRKMVSSGSTARVFYALSAMASTPETTRQYANAVQLTFDGYEDDVREVYEIPEIRRFIQKLHSQFPYWFHFLCKVDSSLLNVMLCMTEVSVDRKGDGTVDIRLKAGGLSHASRKLFGGMNALYRQHGFTEQENREMTRLVKEYLDAYS